MSFFKNIKQQLALGIIKGKQKKISRKKEFHNLESAKNIGIIFDTEQNKNYSIAKKFSEDLNKKGYKVDTIGWVNANELPDFSVGQKIIFYTNKDTKWNGKPNIPELGEFINKEFDLLFVLTESEHISIQYITRLSMAACKVGSLSANKETLDLMIDQSKNKSMENLIKESLNYLTLIKK